MPRIAHAGALAVLSALCAVGPAAAPAAGAELPTPQAVAANAEFLAHVPAPPGGPGRVCVVDTGVTPLPDTAGRIVERIAVDGGTPDDVDHVPGQPRTGHGSFVASVIASEVDGRGSAGIWPAAEIISVRVFSHRDQGATASQYRTAIAECGKLGRRVTVINVSIGDPTTTSEGVHLLGNRVAEVIHRGINVVAAAGNDPAYPSVTLPARFEPVLAVGAADRDGAYCYFANRGVGLDVSAVGCGVEATRSDGDRITLAGSSFASPVVAAITAALRAYRPEISVEQSQRILVETAQRSGVAHTVDAAAAFRAAGLGWLVERYEPRDDGVKTGSGPSRRLARPRIRAVGWRRNVLSVRVSRPPRGADVVFRLDGRQLVRTRRYLRVRTGEWRVLRIHFRAPDGRRSSQRVLRNPHRVNRV